MKVLKSPDSMNRAFSYKTIKKKIYSPVKLRIASSNRPAFKRKK